LLHTLLLTAHDLFVQVCTSWAGMHGDASHCRRLAVVCDWLD
jgi:hypothetical protein